MASTTATRSIRTLRTLSSCHICSSRAGSSAMKQVRNYATPVSSSSSTRSPSSSTTSTPSSSTSNSGGIPNPTAYAVFDRSTKVKQKNRAVKRDIEHSRLTDYVKDEIAANLVERLLVSSIFHPHDIWILLISDAIDFHYASTGYQKEISCYRRFRFWRRSYSQTSR